MDFYLEPNTVKFLLGLYILWTGITMALVCDIAHQNKMFACRIRMCPAELINLAAWVILTVLLIIRVVMG